MSLAVFEIEFPEHLPEQKRRYWSDQLRDAGATVEEAADDRRRVVCEEPKVHHHVGWILFHTAIAKYCRVVATAGAAQAQASAYPKPPSRRIARRSMVQSTAQAWLEGAPREDRYR